VELPGHAGASREEREAVQPVLVHGERRRLLWRLRGPVDASLLMFSAPETYLYAVRRRPSRCRVTWAINVNDTLNMSFSVLAVQHRGIQKNSRTCGRNFTCHSVQTSHVSCKLVLAFCVQVMHALINYHACKTDAHTYACAATINSIPSRSD